MTLIDWVRVVGVGVGLVGAYIVAPDAFTLHRRAVRSALSMASQLVRDHMPFLGRPEQLHSVAISRATGWSTLSAVGSAGGYTRPGPDAPLAEQVAALWQRADGLGQEVSTARADAEKRTAALGDRLDHEIDDLREHARALSDQVAAERVKTTELNGRGLPVIALGIVLSGLPDVLLSSPWSAWPFMLAACSYTVWAFIAQGRALSGR